MTTITRDLDFNPVHNLLQNAQLSGQVPGAVALVRWNGTTVFHQAFGWAALEPERRPMQVDTIFDLASLTKPIATAPLLLQLVERGMIALDDPVGMYLPPMETCAYGQVTVRHLLTHTSGLPAWSPLYVWATRREDVLQTIARMEPAYPVGTQVVYSCLGYIVLGMLIEALTGRALDRIASHWLSEPLGLKDTAYGLQIDRERCAWTERGNVYERTSVAEAGLSFDSWREGYLVGVVHDGNAAYAMNGISGNAGLFGTAHDVSMLGQLWLAGGRIGGTRVLGEQMVRDATMNCTPELNEARGLGWQINAPASDSRNPGYSAPQSAGSQLGTRAYGHTGFTGTSIWVDPDLDLVAVLLTNRVHPVAGDPASITTVRRSFHDAVVTALLGMGHNTPA